MARKKTKRGNNEGSVYQRKNGHWVGAITTGVDPDSGRPTRHYVSGKTREEVAKKVTAALNAVQQGVFVDSKVQTLGEWLDIWLNEYAKAHVRVSTWTSYEMLIRVHIKPAIGNIKLAKLQPHHLQKLYNDKLEHGRHDGRGGLSARTVELIHIVLHSALSQAMKEGLVVRNASEATKRPRREKHEMRVLTLEEQTRLQAVLSTERLGPAFLLDLGTGMRCGELLGLKWENVDLNEGVIRVQQSLTRIRVEDRSLRTELRFQPLKTAKSRRSIPIPQSLIAALKSHKARQNHEKLKAGTAYQDHGLVFCTELGQPIDPRNLARIFARLLEQAGISKATLHTMRHSYATRLLEMNEHPKVVQELLGHSQISMTLDTYSHVMPEIKQAAAAKLDDLLITKSPPAEEGHK